MMRREIAVVLAAMGWAGTAMAQPVQVATEQGVVAGQTADGVDAFRGMPFAAPPVGAWRWRAPQPAAHWAGVRPAVDYGHDCVQTYAGFQPKGSEPAEDCLYVNVWRPHRHAGTLPVLVWIYGGGFVNGSSSRPIYAGTKLARHGIVVVSFNYRLGRFGTFAHPALTRADADHGELGNYGTMDQIAALTWVRRNIAAFGGDRSNVTIFGESAGGMSVHNLIAAPAAAGLFRRAVIASGGDGTSIGGRTLADAEAVGTAFAQGQGIAPDDPAALDKLRALPAEAIRGDVALGSVLRPGPRTFSSPFPQGTVSVDIAAAYAAGNVRHVPTMIGATSGDIGGPDGMMIKGGRTLAGRIAELGVPTYYYRFSYVADAAPTPKGKGAIHADDLPYYFDNADVKYAAATTPRDMRIGGAISRYLVNFVKTGNPNGPGLPAWPAYHGPDGAMMDFATDGTVRPGKDPWAHGAPAAKSDGPALLSPSAG
jgi:para-nitrobenzyl esterase